MSLTPIIITGIVCALIGVAIGSLLSGFYKESKADSSQQASSESEWIEKVSLVSDKEGIGVFPQFQGQVFQTREELPTEKRLLLVEALNEIRTWLGEPAVIPPPTISQATPSATIPSVTPPVSEAVMLSPDVLVQPPPAPVAKPNLNPIDLFAKAIQTDSKPVINAPKSMVAQIDEILQEKLEGSTLEKRGIRLIELPGKGMAVLVGLDRYEGVDEVPDEEIRTLIRSAAKEWEDRLELGGKPR